MKDVQQKYDSMRKKYDEVSKDIVDLAQVFYFFIPYSKLLILKLASKNNFQKIL